MWTYTQILLAFVVPPALLLAFLTRPFVGKMDRLRLLFLIVIAFVYATPWDYLKLAHGVWGYCEGCVLFTVWLIPFEEYCFFVLQTVVTTLWSTLVFYPQLPLLRFLNQPRSVCFTASRLTTILPVSFFLFLTLLGWHLASPSTPLFYLGSILCWASPVLALQWYVAGRYIARMGLLPVSLAIGVPTLYLWAVDTFALRHGAWFIAPHTRLVGWELFGSLPLEEATFFLATNLMVVFGFLTWDRTVCVAENTLSSSSIRMNDVLLFKENENERTRPNSSSVMAFLKRYGAAVLKNDDEISESAVEDVSLSLRLITKGSKSFHLASAFFPPSVRQDVMQLYSWCRACDDLVDDKLAQKNHDLVRRFLDQFLDSVYGAGVGSVVEVIVTPSAAENNSNSNNSVVEKLLPFDRIASFRCIRRLVEKHHMRREELAELIDGFKWDMEMDQSHDQDEKEGEGTTTTTTTMITTRNRVISTNDDLLHYANCVASSVGVMCCRIFGVPAHRTDIYAQARDMGSALQLTNIARDIVTDAKMGRVYVPLGWFESEEERRRLIESPWDRPDRLRQFAEALIGLSEPYYKRAEAGVALLPYQVQKPVMLGLKFYKEIGHTILRSGRYPERAHVPLAEKLAIALRVYFAPTYRDLAIFVSYSLFLAFFLSS